MKVRVEAVRAVSAEGELVVIGRFEDEGLPYGLEGEPGGGEARGELGKTALIHPRGSWSPEAGGGPKRLLAVGLGRREELEAERLRVAAAAAAKEAGRLRLGDVAWDLADVPGDRVSATIAAAAVIDGTALTDFRFDRLKSEADEDGQGRIESLTLLTPGEPGRVPAVAERERIACEAQNRARELQSLPGNLLTPERLAERAAEIAASHESVADETLGPAELEARRMGGMTAVAQGSTQEPRLIVLRYSGGGEGARTLGLVGKAITFDTGGISLKPPASMPDMKMDMSGGAAVIEAMAAIAELRLPVNVIAILPAVENMPSGSAIKPGDVITQYDGTTVEVNNTDAEGRLVLADALTYCSELGAEAMVDFATLTGAVLIALGSTYSGLISSDDELATRVEAAGSVSGELVWRLPLHDEYREMTKGKVADLSNASSQRKAGTIYAGAFLERFAGETPWAHVDIAGTAWDTGRAYLGDGPTGVGTRLILDLAEAFAS